MLWGIRASFPSDVTVPLLFAPAEAVQVDFGAGPLLLDPARGEQRRTWCFVMTLCFSRHQYIEFVFDQSVMTWLGCHRRAFEWFAAVPERIIIDNPKRAYAECAEGYGDRRTVLDHLPPEARAFFARDRDSIDSRWRLLQAIASTSTVATLGSLATPERCSTARRTLATEPPQSSPSLRSLITSWSPYEPDP